MSSQNPATMPPKCVQLILLTSHNAGRLSLSIDRLLAEDTLTVTTKQKQLEYYSQAAKTHVACDTTNMQVRRVIEIMALLPLCCFAPSLWTIHPPLLNRPLIRY